MPIHADYAGPIGILAIKQPDRMVGLGEQAGSGYAKILRAWSEEHWRTPLLRETLQPEYTTLQLPMISLLPQEALDELDRLIGPDFRTLGRDERLALATALIEGRLTNARLREITDKHPRDLTMLLRNLVSRGLLLSDGVGRGTYYQLRDTHNGGALFPLAGTAFLAAARGASAVSIAGIARAEDASTDTLAPKEVEHSDPRSVPSDQEVAHSGLKVAHSDVEVAHFDPEVAHFDPEASTRRRQRGPRTVTEQAILELCRGRFVTPRELSDELRLTRTTIRTHYLRALVVRGMLEPLYPNAPNHPAQAYRTRDSP